jgi:hypothetical protein
LEMSCVFSNILFGLLVPTADFAAALEETSLSPSSWLLPLGSLLSF